MHSPVRRLFFNASSIPATLAISNPFNMLFPQFKSHSQATPKDAFRRNYLFHAFPLPFSRVILQAMSLSAKQGSEDPSLLEAQTKKKQRRF
jgi:hypothetical protein